MAGRLIFGACRRNTVPTKLPRSLFASVQVLKLSEQASIPTEPMLYITPECAKRINEMNAKQQKDRMLRVLVDSGGCSGFAYKFSFDTNLNEDDKIFENEGAKVVVDEVSLELLQGSEVDYAMELIRRSFVVKNNPNADAGCGCGISFSLKDE
eukprot:m.192673 g.192673  ORF g.192673 m.192673 type:complete len:153 (-) comp15659_c0_seq5:5307-5765(-)